MTNSYFNHSPLARFTTADANRLNAILSAIEAGFDKLPSSSELNQGSRNYAIATGSANSYSVTIPYQVLTYEAGFNLRVLIMIANTGSSTLNVNTLGQVTIKRADGTNLQPGDLRASSINDFTYDGTNFRLTSFHGASEAITSANAATSTAAAVSAQASASGAASSAASAAISEITASAAAASSSSTLSSTRFGLRNTILNPLFWLSNPRGNVLTGTFAAGTLIRDRWRAGASGVTLTIANYAMTITAGSIYQVVQGRNMLQTGTYTLSWEGTAPATVNNIPLSSGNSISLTGSFNTTIQWGVGTLYRPQFELSPSRTQFEVRPVDLEILLCAQYFQKSYEHLVIPGTLNATNPYYAIAYNTFDLCNVMIPLHHEMRAIPTVTIYSNVSGLPGRVYNNGGPWDILGTVSVITSKSFRVHATLGNFTTGTFQNFHWVADAEL